MRQRRPLYRLGSSCCEKAKPDKRTRRVQSGMKRTGEKVFDIGKSIVLRHSSACCRHSGKFIGTPSSNFQKGPMKIREIRVPGYERVLLGSDDAAGYQGIIAIHSTALGPAVGGTRYWNYKTEDDAITDALRLARGMTYKDALAGLPFGGGKSIVMRDGKAADREQLFRAHGRMVNSLEGKYFTAEDVGTSPADMEFILK